MAAVLDVRLAAAGDRPPRQLTVHAGAARTTARLRPLGGLIARLTLDEPLPLHAGDRLLLRDPGSAAAAFARRARRRPPPGAPGLGRPGRAGRRGRRWSAPPCWTWPRPRSAAGETPPRPAGNSPPGPSVPAAADLLRRHGLAARR